MTEIKTRRGVYKDLSKSPYVYESPYGDSFKFPSAKRLEIYTRDVEKEIERVRKALDRLNLLDQLPEEITSLIFRTVYKAFYCKTEG